MPLPAETIVDSVRPKSPGAWHGVLTGLAARMHLVRYAGFAGLAICINLLSQNAVLSAFGGFWFGIYVAIAFGNGAGLVFKYIADKYWVFEDTDPSLVQNSRKFALYAAFGVGTTLIFWGVELAFHHIFQSQLMTNVGAVIGLCIGYVIKYNLDKHVTFAVASPNADRPT
ncbi:MAG: GtrA family protein [Hyphomonadaceae bacterium]|nr:GtrA family protein [Hyphomonadaceae bacterium]